MLVPILLVVAVREKWEMFRDALTCTAPSSTEVMSQVGTLWLGFCAATVLHAVPRGGRWRCISVSEVQNRGRRFKQQK